jgi:acyl transferase domain-containing protein/3-hydroxymyristoyl/3-hydroxydecanoyl-(acyl carrier protein) dehydratase
MPAEPRIAIVGMGGLFPSAAGPERLWANVLRAVDASRDVPPGRWLLDPTAAYDPTVAAPDHVYSRRGYFLDDFAPDVAGLDLPPGLLAQLDPVFHLALRAGREAFAAGVTQALDRRRVGVILGNIALPTEKASALARAYLGRTFAEKVAGPDGGFPDDTSPLNRHAPALPAGLLARALGLGGGSYTLDAACASSLYALKLAADELRAGRADAMLAGGVSRPDCLYTQMGFSQLRALSASGRCSPFDARADGLVVGEGAGVFLLKRLDDALRDGDTVLAVIAGVGLSNDVGGGLLAPSSEGQLRAMHAAYREAGWSPHDIDLIECHATGTPVGDAVEFQSLKSLWGDDGWRPGQCVIGSVKSTVGHLLTAAGAAGLTKVLFALREGILPPTANFAAPAPAIDLRGSPFQVLNEPRPWQRRSADGPRRAAVSAFGFGGINAHLLLEEWQGTAGPALPACQAPSAVAVVAMEAHFGPWGSLRSFQERVLGGGRPAEPRPPSHWWGAPDSAWFRAAGLDATPFAGFYLDEVRVAADRFRIPPKELQELLPQQLLMLQVAANALDKASVPDEARPRTGVFIGLGLDLNTTNFHVRWSLKKELRDAAGPPLSANRVMGSLGSIAASRIAREFHLGGPSFTVSSEESSGLRALEAAVRALQRGELDVALVGAVDLAGDFRAVLAAHRQSPFSPTGRACPFDARADGTTTGEGAAAVVLKRLEDMREGETVYAVIRGVGVAGGGAAAGLMSDEGAYRLALERAYEEAGMNPSSVSYVEANASGHPAEDALESRALASFFGAHAGAQPVALGSAKADVGHAGAAAGLASLVKACLALDQQILPPLRHLDRPRPELAGAPRRFLLPDEPRYWLRDRIDGPRRAGVSSIGIDGNCVHVVLEAWETGAGMPRRDRLQPLGPRPEALFVVEGRDAFALREGLGRLRSQLKGGPDSPLEVAARRWYAESPASLGAPLAVGMVARDHGELLEQIDFAQRSLARDPAQPLPVPAAPPAFRDRAFYSPEPLGRTGQVAFVFPGSGNDFPGMGRDLAAHWPELLRRQDGENECLRSQYVPDRFWDVPGGKSPPPENDTRERIFGQVALGSLVTDLVGLFGVAPAAAIGYSLGESAALFALRAWTGRDTMLQAMNASPLFTRDLTGPCDAARRAWRVPLDRPVEWTAGVVGRPPDEVRAACAGVPHAYLLIVNTPRECVLGGERGAVAEVVRRLGCPFVPVPHSTTMHCPVAREVTEPYRDLHRLPTTPPGMRFYSTALGHAYDLSPDSAAEAILAQALDTVDFPAVIETAYQDGVRLFLEMGPGASCTRMIGAILGARPHCARSACVAGADGVSTLLRLLAQLAAERVPLNLDPLYGQESAPVSSEARGSGGRTVTVPVGGQPFRVPPPASVPEPKLVLPPPRSNGGHGAPQTTIGGAELLPQISQTVLAQEATSHAHAAYLRLAGSVNRSLADNLAFQTTLLEKMQCSPTSPERQRGVSSGPSLALGAGPEYGAKPALDRAQCLEFAVGSIARVLGPDYAPVDSFPTRVRLPDEPLMLVDRILHIEGEPRSPTSGRVVTEHDVRPGAWYLNGGRIPTCVAIEAGQADLFLSAFLGIDFQTRGLAVYRLLDAQVTFHGPLPQPGQVIRYDIRIERFFRQADTHLFRFGFAGSVDGEPLLTMTDGCAGFFTPEELAAGRGVVQTGLDRRPQPGVRPDDTDELPPMRVESYDEGQLDALRAGDLAACFGPTFAGVRLHPALCLPSGRMRLLHRVPHIDPEGGRFGMGLVRAEADIDPVAWFLTCHFVDDQVMPGTLMYECCLHTLRLFLLRLGWVAADGDVVCEPVPGVASRLRCRGQVTAATRTVTYEVVLKERGYRPEPYALADALMYADGKPIVEITNMSVRLSGLTREGVRRVWGKIAKPQAANTASSALFDKARLLAFAVGKPSEAYGEPYRPFDSGRFIARLPGPPYQFIDRVTRIDAEPWKMVTGAAAEAQYDVSPDDWYFAAERQPVMPYAVLAEVALQACGWLAAYMGSALTSPDDLCFRNLGGDAELLAAVGPDAGTLTTRVEVTRVSRSAGMIIQSYAFEVRGATGPVYRGTTTFGFFTRTALAQQVGLREARLYEPGADEWSRGEEFPYPREAPFPDDRLRMIDRVDLFVPDGGPAGRGLIRASKDVNPAEWFFKAHFYQDPVWPGSLGLEALVQLLKVAAHRRWPAERFAAMRGEPHHWAYRGQVVPTSRHVTVQAEITSVSDEARELTADGFLLVDGLVIYQMRGFSLTVSRGEVGHDT